MPYRYGWHKTYDGIAMVDWQTGEHRVHQLLKTDNPGMAQEPVFVPRTPDAAEGDGYIIAVVNRVRENLAELHRARYAGLARRAGGARAAAVQPADELPRLLRAARRSTAAAVTLTCRPALRHDPGSRKGHMRRQLASLRRYRASCR